MDLTVSVASDSPSGGVKTVSIPSLGLARDMLGGLALALPPHGAGEYAGE